MLLILEPPLTLVTPIYPPEGEPTWHPAMLQALPAFEGVVGYSKSHRDEAKAILIAARAAKQPKWLRPYANALYGRVYGEFKRSATASGAGATVDTSDPEALHAYFRERVRAGVPFAVLGPEVENIYAQIASGNAVHRVNGELNELERRLAAEEISQSDYDTQRDALLLTRYADEINCARGSAVLIMGTASPRVALEWLDHMANDLFVSAERAGRKKNMLEIPYEHAFQADPQAAKDRLDQFVAEKETGANKTTDGDSTQNPSMAAAVSVLLNDETHVAGSSATIYELAMQDLGVRRAALWRSSSLDANHAQKLFESSIEEWRNPKKRDPAMAATTVIALQQRLESNPHETAEVRMHLRNLFETGAWDKRRGVVVSQKYARWALNVLGPDAAGLQAAGKLPAWAVRTLAGDG